jgi:energy-coupling factor transport system ATP-binding protein
MIEARGYGVRPLGADDFVIRDVDLVVREGERVGVVGESGSGKTTLLHALCGLDRVSYGGERRGELRLDGAREEDARGFAALVPQNPDAQLFGETVADELETSGRDALDEKERARLDDVLDLFGLSNALDDRISTLSLGTKQRLAVASAFAGNSKLLALDEPTNFLDAASADDLFGRLAALNEATGATIVVAEHDVTRLKRWATRIVELRGGALARDVPAADFPNPEPLPPPPSFLSPTGDELRFDRVSYRYPTKRVVPNECSFSAPGGTPSALVGPNGCGKTTALKLAKGLYRPSEGRVALSGEGALMRRVGLAFQNPDDQIFAATVAEECGYWLTNLDVGNNERRRRVGETLERFGLSAYADRSPLTLSYGEKRRLALASVVVASPRALALDEPTVALDRGHALFLRDFLLEYAASGAPVLVASHDRPFVESLGARVIEIARDDR